MKLTLYGITSNGNNFRPVNWHHRIAGLFSVYDNGVSRYPSNISIGLDNGVQFLSFTNPSRSIIAFCVRFEHTNGIKMVVE